MAAVPRPASPPVVRWRGDRELVAWRGWRLAHLLGSDSDGAGPRLLSLSALCIWDGPVARDAAPLATLERPSGIYALKPEIAGRVEWQRSEDCWVTGRVALSGRVVEHALGYRAQCAVIRELRLGVATHLAVRKLDALRDLLGELERRYQAPVDAGHAEREIADRMLSDSFTPRWAAVPYVRLEPSWRIV